MHATFHPQFWLVLVVVAVGCNSLERESYSTRTNEEQKQNQVVEVKATSSIQKSQKVDDISSNKRDRSQELYQRGVDYLANKKYKLAITLLEQACSQGNADGCLKLGSMYGDGIGVAMDEKKAHYWFEQACVAGSTQACDELGH